MEIYQNITLSPIFDGKTMTIDFNNMVKHSCPLMNQNQMTLGTFGKLVLQGKSSFFPYGKYKPRLLTHFPKENDVKFSLVQENPLLH